MKNRISKLRREKGLTQQEVADFLGISKPAIAMYESGKTESIRPDRLLKLSAILDASPSYIMGWSDMRTEVSAEEMEMLQSMGRLNSRGKEQIRLRIWELSQISYYTSDTIEEKEDFLKPVAAHADEADLQVLRSEIERIRKIIDKG